MCEFDKLGSYRPTKRFHRRYGWNMLVLVFVTMAEYFKLIVLTEPLREHKPLVSASSSSLVAICEAHTSSESFVWADKIAHNRLVAIAISMEVGGMSPLVANVADSRVECDEMDSVASSLRSHRAMPEPFICSDRVSLPQQVHSADFKLCLHLHAIYT